MAKYVEKPTTPTVDAIQVNWSTGSVSSEGVRPKNGDWLISHPDGNTTCCGNEYFQNTYMKAGEG